MILYLSLMYIFPRSMFDWKPTDISQSTSGLPARQLPEFTQPTGSAPRTTRENTPMKMFKTFHNRPYF